MNVYREIEEFAFLKRFFASCLTILLVGTPAAFVFSALSDYYYDFLFYFIAIVHFILPAIVVGGFLFSYVVDRWIVKKVDKEGYVFQLSLYSAMGIVCAIPYAFILEVWAEPRHVMYVILSGVINATVFFHLLFWFKKAY